MNPGGWNRATVPTTNVMDQSARMQSIQARLVQRHYVRAELRDINVRKGDARAFANKHGARLAFGLTPTGKTK